MTSDAAILEADQVRKTYRLRTAGRLWAVARDLPALRGVSLRLQPGRIMGLVGESGCGKSTLARLLIGMETPTSGTVHYRGEPLQGVLSQAPLSFRRKVQYIFQDPYSSLPPRMTVRRILTESLNIHRIGTAAERNDHVRQALALVGLQPEQLDRFPHEFSGGQRQRIAIARALVLQPEVLVCDEPTASLDVSIQAQILNTLMELRERFQLTYLFISHDLRVVKHICDEITVMYAGQVVETGPAEIVLQRPAHPYTAALLRSVPDHRRHREQTGHAPGLKGEMPNLLALPKGCPFASRCPVVRDTCADTQPAVLKVGSNHTAACLFPITD